MPEFILNGRDSLGFRNLDEFVQGYVEAAFFTAPSPDEAEGGIPKDCGFHDLPAETVKAMQTDCERFVAVNAEALDAMIGAEWDGTAKYGPYNAADAGRDFWFTRNGHGVGFWDRGFKNVAADAADVLSSAASAFGECYLYLGDDGKVYYA